MNTLRHRREIALVGQLPEWLIPSRTKAELFKEDRIALLRVGQKLTTYQLCRHRTDRLPRICTQVNKPAAHGQ
jgi:hypothetical protein